VGLTQCGIKGIVPGKKEGSVKNEPKKLQKSGSS